MNTNTFQHNPSFTHSSLLSSAAPWIILMTTGLWLVQTSPLRAMGQEDQETAKNNNISEKSVSTRTQQQRLKASGVNIHLSIQKLSENEHLSDRLKKVKIDAHDLDKVGTEKIEQCKKILQCSRDNFDPPHGFNELIFDDLIITAKDKGGGFSDAIVPPPITINGKRIIIKQFKHIKHKENIEHGIKELLDSLAAWELNPVPATLKMAKICDAAYCINGTESCLSIIMECASGEDIKACLPKDCAEDSIRAFAEYLADFHIHHHEQLNETISKENYLSNTAKFIHTLSENPLDEEEKKQIKLLNLLVKKQLEDLKDVSSNNILQLLSKEEQQKVAYLVKGVTRDFVKNSSEIYRLLNSQDMKKQAHYFSTITHGDAHSKNFFYDSSPPDRLIPLDSFDRIMMIDYASMIKTYGKIGDPAEDVGRFLGSLWEWAAQETEQASEMIKQELYDKIIKLQKIFIDIYSRKIKAKISTEKSQQKFEKIFKENYNFYKLRFYRVIFNSIQDKEIKSKIIRSWLQENADKADSLQKRAQATRFIAEELEFRKWPSLETGTLYCNLPDPVEGFITSTAEGADRSYLTKLWQILHEKSIATLTSTVTLAGEGGIGKTTLAIAYGQEALYNKAYTLIYKILGSTEEALLKSYRDLLQELGIQSDKGIELQHAAELVKKHLPENTLLIVDNVPLSYADGTPAPEFLKDKLPQKKHTHIIITSRSHEGWNSLLSLEAFRPTDSIKYLLKITGLKVTDANREIAGKIAGKLAEELEHFPLALSHAAYYLKLVGGKDISAKHFEEYFQGLKNLTVEYFEQKKNSLELEKSKITYEHLIDKTLQMSKGRLSQLAQDLLDYCAYLSPDNISEDIFPDYEKKHEEIQDALKLLSLLSLIQYSEFDNLYSIHRLQQLVIRNNNEKNKTYKEIFSRFSPAFIKIFEKNIFTNEQIGKLLFIFPHINQLLSHSHSLKISFDEIERFRWVGEIIYWLFSFEEQTEESIDHLIEYCKNKSFQTLKKLRSSFRINLQKHDTPDWLKKIGENSHPAIQTALGYRYFSFDWDATIYWWTKAAEQNYLPAQVGLSAIYANRYFFRASEIVECKSYVNHEWDDVWSRQAMAQRLENSKGMVKILGLCHVQDSLEYQLAQGLLISLARNGDDKAHRMLAAKQEYNNSKKWTMGAAKNGLATAQSHLARMYAGEGNYKETEKWFLEAAKQGHADCQNALGFMYLEGQGVPKDETKACYWFFMAAVQGYPLSQFNLGRVYEYGIGVENDYEMAVEYYKLAADQGFIKAQHKLGSIYQYGIGVDKNPVEAVRWYTLAATEGNIEEQQQYFRMVDPNNIETTQWKTLQWKTQKSVEQIQGNGEVPSLRGLIAKQPIQKKTEQIKGDRDLQFLLGEMYDKGTQIPENKPEAIRWYKLAAKQGITLAQFRLGMLYEGREGVAKNPSKSIRYYKMAAEKGHEKAQLTLGDMYCFDDGIDKNGMEAVRWYREPALKGNVRAQFNIGMIYELGDGVPKSFSEAIRWYKMAAEQGHEKAPGILGDMYYFGEDVSKSFDEAFRWYKMAALQGDARAQFMLGMMYEDGEGVDKNNFEAFRWTQMAALQGSVVAQCFLGKLFENGKGTDKNPRKALFWYGMAASQGFNAAQYSIAEMYANGKGIKKNISEAIHWYKRAAENGYADAQFELGLIYEDGTEGITKNYIEAFKLYSLAADQGHTQALKRLGVMYVKGQRVDEKDIRPFVWHITEKGPFKNFFKGDLK